MPCLYCESTLATTPVFPTTTIFNNKEFGYLQCGQCKLIYIDPIPTKEDYAAMYSDEYHDAFYFASEQPADYNFLLPLLAPYRTTDTMLDYGCGDAGFLRFFQNNNFKCTGAEFTEELVLKLRNKFAGIDFLTIDAFWENNDKKLYNFIHFGDVLEHLEEPISFIKKLSKRLEDEKGLMIFEGPIENNRSLALFCRYATSWVLNKMKPNRKARHVPYHITFSNSKNQIAFFERCGLEQVHYSTFEASWPYPETFTGGIGRRIQYLIGKVSMGISNMLGTGYGNRFTYIGRLKQ